MLSISWFVPVIFAVQFLGLQTAAEREKEPCFIVPSEDVLAVIANQPDSPIEFVSAYHVGYLSGGGRNVYTIRNRGTQPIKAYTIGIVGSEGGDSEHSTSLTLPAAYFMPGKVWSSIGDRKLNIVPLTDQLRQKHKVKGEMRAIKIFMVVHVELADGSVYNAEPAYKSLLKFFDENSIFIDNEGTQKDKRK